MAEQWTGEIVALLHVNKISQRELANELGVTDIYISMLLNGARKTPSAKERMEAAINAIIERRKEEGNE